MHAGRENSDAPEGAWAQHGWDMNASHVASFICAVTMLLLLSRLAGIS